MLVVERGWPGWWCGFPWLYHFLKRLYGVMRIWEASWNGMCAYLCMSMSMYITIWDMGTSGLALIAQQEERAGRFGRDGRQTGLDLSGLVVQTSSSVVKAAGVEGGGEQYH